MNDQQLNDLVQRLRPLLAAEFLNLRTGYASGSWTPAWGGSTGNGTITHGTQSGSYVRIGTTVFAWCNYLTISVLTANPTGNLWLTNLPFTSVNDGNRFQVGTMMYDNFNLAAGVVQVAPLIEPNTTRAIFVEAYDNAATTAVQGAALSVTTALRALIIYEAAL